MNRLLHLLRPSSRFTAIAASTLIATTLGWTTQAFAAAYGDFYDTINGSVTYRNVNDLNGLFGAPTILANELSFAPVGFEADCSTDPGCPPTAASAADTIAFEIDADAGAFIPRIQLKEDGTTLIDDLSLPGGFATATVVADVFVDILEINGVSIPGINASTQMFFTDGGYWDTGFNGNGVHVWSGQLDLDLDAIIANAGQTGIATRIQVSVANTLTAQGLNGATAFIEKDNFSGFAVKVVPEPGTALLLGLGLAGLAGTRRREI